MLFAAAVLALSACSRLSVPLQRPVVVWQDPGQTQPYFVEDNAIDTLPSAARAEIESALEVARKQEDDLRANARASGLTPPRCGPGTIGDSLASTDSIDLLRGVPIVLTGRITAVVNGWNVPRHRVVSLVFLRVDNVLKGSDAVGAGDALTVELPFGTLHHRGATWCTEMAGNDRIVAGRALLVAGRLDSKRAAPNLLGTGWPIEHNQVLPPNAAPLSLDLVRTALR
jgi:hypothetical protein